VKVALFDFNLPPDRVAQHPVSPRDAARLLVVGQRELEDRVIRDLPRLLRRGDRLVYNDTRVIKARLDGRRGAAGIEVTLHRRLAGETWRAFARPAKKLKAGDVIDFAPGFTAETGAKGEGGEVTLVFSLSGAVLDAALERHGRMPLPPYIKRARGGDRHDDTDYQTVWGKRAGAVAASTAGFHFTEQLLAELEAAGITRTALTLHVGAGTFLPVKVDDTRDHKMHSEWGELTAHAAEEINATHAAGGRIVAVGTTALRVLEAVADESGRAKPWSGETDLFITPGYRFKTVDLMLTNFHLPRSTLLMLAAAFAGPQRIRTAYAHAVAHGYRFYSYGDCCLLYPAGAVG
jgi:S-adenosylmethionine:tRNA ribosyltransferase-isomerase